MAENKNNSNIAYKTLIAPWITEAASVLAEANKYVFKVDKRANKGDVKKAVESLFKVTVISVRIINLPGKKRIRGRVEGKTAAIKKAIVTLKEGDSINIYESK